MKSSNLVMLPLYLIIIALIGIIVLVPFLNSLEARILVNVTPITLGLLIHIFIRKTDLERNILSKILITMIVSFIFFIYPVMLKSLLLFVPRNFVKEDMLIYNYELINKNDKLIFFLRNHHTYYPLSYIMAKILFEVTKDPWFIEVCLFSLISSIIIIVFSLSLTKYIRHGNNPFFLVIILYLIGIFGMNFFQIATGPWWFRSLGVLETMITILLVTGQFQNKNIKIIAPLMLIYIAILASESIIPIYLIAFFLYSYYLHKSNALRKIILILIIGFLIFQSIINFISYLNYANYLPILKLEFFSIFEVGDPSKIVHKIMVERASTQPLMDRIIIVASYIVIYIVIPAVIFFYFWFKSKICMKKIMVPFFFLATGLSFIVGSRLIPNLFVNIPELLIKGFYSFNIMALLSYYMANRYGAKKESSSKRYNTISMVLSIVILWAFFANYVFYYYPVSLSDPKKYIEDPRAMYIDAYYINNFVNNYWDNFSKVIYLRYLSHFSGMYLNKEIFTYSNTINEKIPEIVLIPRLDTVNNELKRFYGKVRKRLEYKDKVYDSINFLISFFDKS